MLSCLIECQLEMCGDDRCSYHVLLRMRGVCPTAGRVDDRVHIYHRRQARLPLHDVLVAVGRGADLPI